MIKCYFVDVKSISSDVDRSNFDESELDRLADLILATDGLIRPLILREIGVEKYTVIEGHREYYAAVIAKEKDLRKAEMVNAFVIKPSIQQIAIDQLQLLSGYQQPISNPVIAVELKDSAIEKISSLISQQMQALHQEIANVRSQLVEHKKIIDNLTSELAEHKEILKSLQIIKPVPPIIAPDPDPDPDPKNITLNLINTLTLADLSRRMQQSGIRNATKLAESIITARNQQPEQKFNDWKIAILKVSGLAAKTATNIIEKLH